MGKTQSIEREAQSNQNFQNYLESLHKQLEDKTNTDFEKNRLFGGFCGRDSGIGPAQRAKTTIWN